MLIWLNLLAVYVLIQYSCYIISKQMLDIKSTETIIIERIKPETEYITEYITVEVVKDADTSKYITLQLKFNNIEQNPELPTGCEVTALTSTLNYFGYDIDKLTLADSYLPKGEIGKTHPNEAFIGNPRSKHSYGAYAPVITETANTYLKEVNSKYKAYNISGNDFSELTKYLYNGYPVIIWATMNMSQSYLTTKWNLKTGEFQWRANQHCLVLVGFTEDDYIIADPLKKGLTYYDKDLVEKRYNELYKQAVVIY